MNLKNISNQELITGMQKLVASERKCTHLILLHINEMESRRLYADLGYESLYSYLTKNFGYCESSAYRRIQSARLLKQVPVVAEKLESGVLNLSQLSKVQKCLKAEKSQHKNQLNEMSQDEKVQAEIATTLRAQSVLAMLEKQNNFATDQILAKEFNQAVQIHEITKPQQDYSVRIEITFSKEDYEHCCPVRSFA